MAINLEYLKKMETMTPAKRILLFTGDGKGKTTAALGMVLRALGHGMRVAVYQFIKDDDSIGELSALRIFSNLHIVQLGCGFIPPETSPAFGAHVSAARQGLAAAAAALSSGQWDLVVLDEINVAVCKTLVEEADVIAAVKAAAPASVVVLTGRRATAGLIELADTVTEMRPVKHGFTQGYLAQKGVEF